MIEHDRGSNRRVTVACAMALLACAVAGLVQYVLQPLLGDRLPFAAFPAAIAVAAWFGGPGSGLVATLIAATAATAATTLDSLFPGPVHWLRISDPADALALALFALSGVVISMAIGDLRREAGREREIRIETARALGHSAHLQELSAALSRATTGDQVIQAGLAELLHAFDAAAGAVVLAGDDERTYEIAHVVGYAAMSDRPFDSAQGRPKLSPAATALVARAMRQQELILIESHVARDADFPDLAADEWFGRHEAAAVLPLGTVSRAVGSIVLGFHAPRRFAGDERRFLLGAGRHLAQALARARLYEQAERARAEGEEFRVRAAAELRERQKAEEALRESEVKYRALAVRTNRLYALSAGLSEASTLDAVAKVIVRQGKVVVGASAGSVALLVEGGAQFEPLYAEEYTQHGDTWWRFAAEPGLCTTIAVNTKAPVYIGSFDEWQRQYPRSAALAADGGYASTAALPLLAEGAVLGVLSFHFTVPVNFSEEYRALLESVAQLCVQAIDRARLYEATERARTEAETANRSKDEFLSTVSHELRTPLNAMLGWAAMLRGGAVDPSRTARALDAIFSNATRQAHLIEELLDVSRIVAGRALLDLQEFDLTESLRGAVDAIMPMAESKGVELRREEASAVAVVADPRRLEQVFLNLLTNAVKFTPAGGSIAVDMRAAGASVEVTVVDTGIGIDSEFLPHVFERFRQADSSATRRVGGLGLGLFIARHLVEAQGGTLRVQSEGLGRGTTFTVSLPVAGAAGEVRHLPGNRHHVGDSDHPAAGPPLHGIRVLLVDDEPDAREMMTAVLETRGATVRSAGSVPDALKTLVRSDFDVLLADIAMPGEDGYELIKKIRGCPDARVNHIPAAAVTACASDEDRQRALAAGFQVHLAKPVRPAELALAVSDLMQLVVAAPPGARVPPTPSL